MKYELQTVDGVSEVATIGGMVRQYQVVVDPDKLRAYDITLPQLRGAIQAANRETGGSVIEMGEAEFMVRSTGYVDELADLARAPLMVNERGAAVTLGDVADIRFGPELRRGVGEFGGEGDAVGGVVILRWGGNALATIKNVEERIEQIRPNLPEGVELVTTYSRAGVIERAIDNLQDKLTEEFIVVVLVCAAFLLHLRSSLVILLSLPLGIFAAFIIMKLQGVNANIMSLGGIAIAIGAMVDAAIVMIEANAPQAGKRKADQPEQMADRRRMRVRSGACTVLFAGNHHGKLPPGLRAGKPGRQAFQTAGLYQDLRNGGGGNPVDHAGPGPDGVLRARADHAGTQEPAEPRSDLGLSPVSRRRGLPGPGQQRCCRWRWSPRCGGRFSG